MISYILYLVTQHEESNWGELSQTLDGKSGIHSYKIEIVCQNFQPRGRKITWKVGYNPTIDGRRTWGLDSTEGGSSAEAIQLLKERAIEVRTFTVHVDGKGWRVPSTLFFDLLNLDLNPTRTEDYGKASLSMDGKTLTLDQEASDGAGGYEVHFKFHAKGPVERKINIEDEIVDVRQG